MGISEQTFYRWKKQFTGLEIDQVRQLKQLQDALTMELEFMRSEPVGREVPQAQFLQAGVLTWLPCCRRQALRKAG